MFINNRLQLTNCISCFIEHSASLSDIETVDRMNLIEVLFKRLEDNDILDIVFNALEANFPEEALADLYLVVILYFEALFSNTLYRSLLSDVLKENLGKILFFRQKENKLQPLFDIIEKAATARRLTSEIIRPQNVSALASDFINYYLKVTENEDEEESYGEEGDEEADEGGDEGDDEEVENEENSTLERVSDLLFGKLELAKEYFTLILNHKPRSLFYRILADERVTPAKWKSFVEDVEQVSKEVRRLYENATIVVFVDELNTAGCLGMVIETFMSHSLNGRPLPKNIFFVGAINPHRAASTEERKKIVDYSKVGGSREEDETVDYLYFAPYIVKQLSPSANRLLNDFPNLSIQEEKRFLEEFIAIHLQITPPSPADIDEDVWTVIRADLCRNAVDLIIRAQAAVRRFELPRLYMSIRHLIRATHIFKSLVDHSFYIPTVIHRGTTDAVDKKRIFLPANDDGLVYNDPMEYIQRIWEEALYVTVAITYMFQLPGTGHIVKQNIKNFRAQLLLDIFPYYADEEIRKFKEVVGKSLDHFVSYAKIPKGLALTDALKENFYTIALCTMNKFAVLISGPPGKLWSFYFTK